MNEIGSTDSYRTAFGSCPVGRTEPVPTLKGVPWTLTTVVCERHRRLPNPPKFCANRRIFQSDVHSQAYCLRKIGTLKDDHAPAQFSPAILIVILFFALVALVTPASARTTIPAQTANTVQADSGSALPINLVPQPVSVTPNAGTFASPAPPISAFAAVTRRLTPLATAGRGSQTLHRLCPDELGRVGSRRGYCSESRRIKHSGDEGYTLNVTSTGIAISAYKAAGLFYGVQLLRQLFSPWIESASVQAGPWVVPNVSITDYPRYAVLRGFQLDIARHYESEANAKRAVDSASAFKINKFHLHLSDDQGFRVVINNWHELTDVGAQFSINNEPGHSGRKPSSLIS